MGLAVLFPGQGTQFPRMGEPWRETDAWAIVERAEAAPSTCPSAPLLLVPPTPTSSPAPGTPSLRSC